MAQITPSGLVDARNNPISTAQIDRVRAQANADMAERRGWGNPYDGAAREGEWTSNWRTGIKSPDLEYLPFRDQLVARARDLARNEPIAGAAIARRKNSAVGRGWRLSSKPDARVLGITPEQAATLGLQIEAEWRMFAYGHAFEIDAERRLNFGQLLRVATHHYMADGEGFGLAEWAPDEPTRYRTRLRIVDPDRVSNPNGRINDALWRAGIEHNPAGVPIRYWIREAHPADFNYSGRAFQWLGVDRFTPWGRPQVFHWFDPERAAQSRGVTRFVQTLKAFRGFAKFTDATLQNAALNALYAGFIQSSAGPEAVSESLTPGDLKDFDGARQEFYEKHGVVDGNGARFAVLPFGDEIKMATAAREVTGFDQFTRAIIRLIASSLGVTYEEISMDYSQTNYSSARAALIHAAAETDALAGILQAQLVQPFFVAWLEEAVESGRVALPEGAPSFHDAIDAYAAARWIGPKRGYIDPTKEILAAAARIEAGVSTLEKECADQGDDWEEITQQLAREAALRKKLGLETIVTAEAQAIQDTKNPSKAAPTPTDDSGDPAPPPEDVRPADPNKKAAAGGRRMGFLRRIAAFAHTSAHEAEMNDRRAA